MKQNEEEWVEYKNVMEDVVKRSGLDKNIFYDLRGNHDNFGVPMIGGSLDFYSKYSINGQLGRSGHVNSVTLTLQVTCFLSPILCVIYGFIWKDNVRFLTGNIGLVCFHI